MCVSRDCPISSGTPYYLRHGKSYGFQIWPVHSQGPSEQKTIKNFVEKGAWAYLRTAKIFSTPPIISGMGKATNFKFCMHIYGLNRNKSPFKNFGKGSRGRRQGLPKIFRAPTHRAHHAVIFAIAQLFCYHHLIFKASGSTAVPVSKFQRSVLSPEKFYT